MVKGAIDGLTHTMEVSDREQSEKIFRLDIIEKQIETIRRKLSEEESYQRGVWDTQKLETEE